MERLFGAQLVAGSETGNTMKTFTLISTLLVLPAALGFKLLAPPSVTEVVTEICNTPDCVKKAAEMLLNMNDTVDPCDDFYEFACGGFIDRKEIPDTEGQLTNSFYPVTQTLLKQCRILVDEAVNKDSDWDSDILVKDMYKSCMDQETRDAKGSKPLEDLLKEVVGGWPVLEMDWDEKDFDWKQALFKLREKGFSTGNIISVDVDDDLVDNTKRVIYLQGPAHGISREYLVNGTENETVKKYYNHMLDIVEYMGGKKEEAEAELMEVLKFEIALANLTLSREEKRNISKVFNPFVLKDLPQDDDKSMDWLNFIKGMSIGVLDDIVTEDVTVVVTEKVYFTAIPNLLKKTPARVIANHLSIKMARKVLALMDKKADDIRFAFKKAARGVEKPKPQWKKCLFRVGFNSVSSKSPLKVATASMYARRYFPLEEKKSMVELVKYVKASMEKVLNEVNWMDEETRSKALVKLSVMKEQIAYPNEILEEAILSEHFDELTVDSKDFIGNALSLQVWQDKFEFGRLNIPVDPDHWLQFTNVAVINAFAALTSNAIQFPAGILQGSFYNGKLPNYVNYAGVGSVIGHEITHNFDYKGKQFDAKGNLITWWDPKTEALYKKKAQCIVDQYSNFKSEQVGLNLNGITTQGESIADNGGVNMAYNAYGEWVKDNSEEPIMPGISLKPQQLYWLSQANLWCSKYKDESLKRRIITAAHPPARFRVNGPVSNSKEFAEAFNCPVGSDMNPKDKCVVW